MTIEEFGDLSRCLLAKLDQIASHDIPFARAVAHLVVPESDLAVDSKCGAGVVPDQVVFLEQIVGLTSKISVRADPVGVAGNG